jgi:hypothetical protein
MNNGKTKLELTWTDKENQPRLDLRIIPEQIRSYSA